jgi:hypothetical protein
MWAMVRRNGVEENRKEAKEPEPVLLCFGIGKFLVLSQVFT